MVTKFKRHDGLSLQSLGAFGHHLFPGRLDAGAGSSVSAKSAMIDVPFFILACLFVVKIVDNLTVPYRLAMRPTGPRGESTGISLMSMVEVALFVGIEVLSLLGFSPYEPRAVALVAITAIVGSYVHLVVAGVAAGWVASLWHDRKAHSHRK